MQYLITQICLLSPKYNDIEWIPSSLYIKALWITMSYVFVYMQVCMYIDVCLSWYYIIYAYFNMKLFKIKRILKMKHPKNEMTDSGYNTFKN